MSSHVKPSLGCLLAEMVIWSEDLGLRSFATPRLSAIHPEQAELSQQSRLSRVTRKARANDPSKAALMPWQENECVMKPNQATAEQFEHSQHPVHKLCCKLHPVFGALPPKLPGLEERVPVSKEFIWRAGPL